MAGDARMTLAVSEPEVELKLCGVADITDRVKQQQPMKSNNTHLPAWLPLEHVPRASTWCCASMVKVKLPCLVVTE
jgi:hypothetical protein